MFLFFLIFISYSIIKYEIIIKVKVLLNTFINFLHNYIKNIFIMPYFLYKYVYENSCGGEK